MTSKTQLKKEKYFLQVEEWKKKYLGVNADKILTLLGKDLTRVSLKFDRICAKKGCDNTYALHRHHKGHDYIFACILPDIYAARYILYHSDDCIYLCKKHHQAVHRYYKPVVDEFFRESEGLTGGDLQQLCEQTRTRLTEMCENFLLEKTRHVKSRRKRVAGKRRE